MDGDHYDPISTINSHIKVPWRSWGREPLGCDATMNRFGLQG